MQTGSIMRPHAGAKRWRTAMYLAPLLLAGCACNGAQDDWVWDDRASESAFLAPDAGSEEISKETSFDPECSVDDIARYSQLSAQLAGRADPALLKAARLDAERVCLRTAALRGGGEGIK
ncbi:MAG: hypothetical protein ABL894_08660 [Hyphomicrobium sp.]